MRLERISREELGETHLNLQNMWVVSYYYNLLKENIVICTNTNPIILTLSLTCFRISTQRTLSMRGVSPPAGNLFRQSGRVQMGKELSIDRRVKPTVTRTAYLSFSQL